MYAHAHILTYKQYTPTHAQALEEEAGMYAQLASLFSPGFSWISLEY